MAKTNTGITEISKAQTKRLSRVNRVPVFVLTGDSEKLVNDDLVMYIAGSLNVIGVTRAEGIKMMVLTRLYSMWEADELGNVIFADELDKLEFQQTFSLYLDYIYPVLAADRDGVFTLDSLIAYAENELDFIVNCAGAAKRINPVLGDSLFNKDMSKEEASFLG
jgi:hypothetical protein